MKMIQKTYMDSFIGMGNALVDALFLIEDDEILKDFGFKKGAMQLVNKEGFLNLSERMTGSKRERTTGGYHRQDFQGRRKRPCLCR